MTRTPVATRLVGAPGLRCLVIDDQATTLERSARILRAHPAVAQVASAPSARVALQIMRTARFDVAFIEAELADLDGVELARAFRRTVNPPEIVFVTRRPDRAVEAFELGALDYLTKPSHPDRLAESLRRVALARPVSAPPSPAAAEAEPPGI